MIKIGNLGSLKRYWSDELREELAEMIDDTIYESERSNVVYKIYFDYHDGALWRLEAPDYYEWSLWNDPEAIMVIDMRSNDEFLGADFDGFDKGLEEFNFDISYIPSVDVSEIMEEIEKEMW